MQTQIRKIGNSKGTIIPASILHKLNLKEGDSLDIQDDNGQIIIQLLKDKPSYTLDELLARCDMSADVINDDLTAWDNASAVGNESW